VEKKPAAVHLLKYDYTRKLKKSLIRLDKSKKQDKISNTRLHVKALDKNSRQLMDASNPIGVLFVSRRTIDSQEILSAGIGKPDKTNDLPQTKLALLIRLLSSIEYSRRALPSLPGTMIGFTDKLCL
jgi:hypothetical protein